MIRYLVDFALREKFLVLSLGVLLLIWGVISFHRLPVEAYPDVADNYVNVITQWPGRAAEEVERQVTVPLELQMNGLPHLTHLRSVSLFGISSVTMIFDDDSNDFENRQQVLERLSLVNLPGESQPADRAGLQPGRPNLFLHAAKHRPALRHHGAEVAPGLGGAEAIEVRTRISPTWTSSEGSRANIRCRSIPTS